MPLIDKLKQIEAQKHASSEELKQRLQLWKKAVEQLFAQITQQFGDLEKEKLAAFRIEDIRITEEPVGSYGTKRLIMRVAGRDIIFEPVGLLIIGAAGRIDMYPHGLRSRGYMLLRTNDKNDWVITPMETQGVIKLPPEAVSREVLERIIENLIETYPDARRP